MSREIMEGVRMSENRKRVLLEVKGILKKNRIHVSIETLNSLFGRWDKNTRSFNEFVRKQDHTLDFHSCRRIDELLSKTCRKVHPGGLWWSAYDYVCTENGHGLFPFKL